MSEKLHKRTLIGEVVSDRMDKTVVVSVQRATTHPLYHKTIRLSKRYKAHDEANDCRVGDRVEIIECRPLSKDKKFRVAQIIERAV
ncbi:MAG: 30S ribosomal protein S17 [Nitrospirae bacterium CG18_big_fil_WC_8_21_14_2_50_70_55]|nr:30S ribosomal protein S17 [Deltaproteobacteria bacterium]OIP67006.1 MAG: 30S ribosomal protein S17 [Nitrospirae bacterium CG2_30_70_394]PIQ07271.1 MAG: 30S ribosomal protein S17 [Nitrospirae bacterium CG18_big_fil_WC_8_21_14_2_50_70_55]PIU80136.1 MAG: 30S ribosomal protein S17 [Nitrospirae bacterium CG06_land_8_20_14_3_00_70_43]PIW82689.1 MAG: 30S ribosomal protein S17 [Nitrospirae bacterium CG_4_8_14_3_um_filter_70_85]PIX84032.1 MAG: 30S ribosomal protein S17 [Nitrospirae bacterium CG_4_10